MATPILKCPVELTQYDLKSRHRKLSFLVKRCVRTKCMQLVICENTVSCEKGNVAFASFQRAILQERDIVDVIKTYTEEFFGKGVEVSMYISHAMAQVEVMHEDEILKEMEDSIPYFEYEHIYRQDRATFTSETLVITLEKHVILLETA